MLSSQKEIVDKIIKWAASKKAENIKYYDVREFSDYTDIIIICHGTAELHNKAIAEEILYKAKAEGIQLLASEGLANGTWILLDFVDIIVHIFNEETRNFYKLEELWNISSKTIKDNRINNDQN